MQLGLYLQDFLVALSGVQSLRILAGYQLFPPHLSEPAPSVHRERQFQEPVKALVSAVLTVSHRTYDRGEFGKLFLLRREQRTSFEERDHLFKQVPPSPDDEYDRPITRAIALDVPAPKSFP
ncbi:MAG: hypothetical protein WBC33_11210 [Conexibacter sp.]